MTRDRVVPEGWQEARIGEVSTVNPPKPTLRDSSDQTPVLFIPMAALDDVTGHIVAAESRSLGEVRDKSYRTFTSGDVLFAKITPCMENGKAAVVPDISTGLGFGSTEFHVLRPGPSLDRRYLWHFIRQEAYRKGAEHHMTGSVGQARVPKEFVEQSTIPIPPIEEQRGIAAVLDEATANGLSASGHLAAAKVAIERFRQSVFTSACAGRLTADWREDNQSIEPATQLLGLIRAARQGTQRPIEPEEVDAPEGEETPPTWTWVRFGSVIGELKNGVSIAPAMEPPGIPILRISAVRRASVDFGDLRFLRDDIHRWMPFTLRDGDLLFTRYNGSISLLGVCGMVRGLGDRTILHPDKLMKVRFDHHLILPEYVEIFFAAPPARARMTAGSVSSAGQQGISGTTVKSQSLALPPLEEQKEIVRRVSKMLQVVDGVERSVEKAAKRVELSSQAVLAKAFRGELSATA